MRATNLAKAIGFDQHVRAILEDFSQQYVWLDKEKSSLAVFLVDALAGVSEVGQTQTMFALREAFLRRARRESSILANVKFLGVEIPRKSGAAVTAELRNNSDQSLTISAFSQMTIGGRAFYNTQGTVLEPKQNKLVPLVQGTVSYKTFDLSQYNLEFPEIYLGVDQHQVSNNDIQIRTIESNGVNRIWSKHTDSLYEMSPEFRGYLESTTETGDVAFLFGNGRYGVKLPANATLEIRYIVTDGIQGNIGSPGSRVQLNNNSAITGITTEAAVGGADQIDPNFFKLYGSALFESRGTLSRQAHWDALASYPDVADIVVQGQREIAPDDPSWMNHVRMCVLPKQSSSWGGTNPNPDSAQWRRFLQYVRERCSPHLQIIPFNPEKILIDVLIEVYVFKDVDASLLEADLTKAVQKFFSRRKGLLGRTLEPSSDLVSVIKLDETGQARVGIDYIKIPSPSKPIVPTSKISYVAPRSIKVVVKYSQRSREI